MVTSMRLEVLFRIIDGITLMPLIEGEQKEEEVMDEMQLQSVNTSGYYTCPS